MSSIISANLKQVTPHGILRVGLLLVFPAHDIVTTLVVAYQSHITGERFHILISSHYLDRRVVIAIQVLRGSNDPSFLLWYVTGGRVFQPPFLFDQKCQTCLTNISIRTYIAFNNIYSDYRVFLSIKLSSK